MGGYLEFRVREKDLLNKISNLFEKFNKDNYFQNDFGDSMTFEDVFEVDDILYYNYKIKYYGGLDCKDIYPEFIKKLNELLIKERIPFRTN